MNHAYIDASWQEQPDGSGLGGWGLVLLLPGRLPTLVQGQLDAPDNNAAELRAVLEALRVAPAGEALTVHTDNQAVIACVARGRGPTLLSEATQEILAESQQRGVHLLARSARRTARHLQTAHVLANEARRGHTLHRQGAPTEVLLEHKPPLPEARVSLRRGNSRGQTERVTMQLTFDPLSEVPPSVQLLLAAVALARPGETLQVRRASKVAQAMWLSPGRALRQSVQKELLRGRELAEQQAVQVIFEGLPVKVE